MTQLNKLLCTHCLNSLMDFAFCFIIYKSLLWIYFEYGECQLTKIFHYLQVLWLSHFKMLLKLSNNELTGTIPTEMGNMKLSQLLCIHCLNSSMDFLSVWLFVYLCYEYNIWRWRVLIDQNISSLASLVTFSFQRVYVSFI